LISGLDTQISIWVIRIRLLSKGRFTPPLHAACRWR